GPSGPVCIICGRCASLCCIGEQRIKMRNSGPHRTFSRPASAPFLSWTLVLAREISSEPTLFAPGGLARLAQLAANGPSTAEFGAHSVALLARPGIVLAGLFTPRPSPDRKPVRPERRKERAPVAAASVL